jgi:autotransporter-associated beta strand protein
MHFSWYFTSGLIEETYFSRGLGGYIASTTPSTVTDGTFAAGDHLLVIDRGRIDFKFVEADPVGGSHTSTGTMYDLARSPWWVVPTGTATIAATLTKEDADTATYRVEAALPVSMSMMVGFFSSWRLNVWGVQPGEAAGSFTRNITRRSAADGPWDGVSTWDAGDRFPTLGYNAEVGPHTVGLATDAECRNLRIVDALGKLIVGPDRRLSVQKAVAISAGELDVQGNFQAASLELSGGTLNMNRRDLPVTGPVVFSGGAIRNCGVVPVTPSLTGAGHLVLDDSTGPVTTTFAGAEFDRGTTRGTLVLVPANDHLNAGEYLVYGALATRPSGMVAPYMVRQKGAADTRGDFLAKSGAHLVTATYDSVDFLGAGGASLVDVQGTPTIGSLAVEAVKVAGTVTVATGATLTIASGGLVLNGGRIVGGTVDVGPAEALVYVSAAGGTISSKLTGAAGLTKFGPGTLRLADPSYSGNTIIREGAIDLDVSGTWNCTGSLSGNGSSLIKTGAGTMVLSGADSEYTGEVRVMEGTLTIGHELALQQAIVNLDPADAGALGFAGGVTASTFGGLKGSRSMALSNADGAAVVLAAGNNDGDTTYSGRLSGAGGVSKVGNGSLVLEGENTYTAGTSVLAGTLCLGHAAALGTGPLSVADGTLDLHGHSPTVPSLSGAGTVTNNAPSGDAALTVDLASPLSQFDGALTDGSSPLALIKSGAGELTLAGANTYTAGTTVLDGTLRLAADDALGTGPLSVAGGTLDLHGHSPTVPSLSGAGTVTNNAPGGDSTLTVDLASPLSQFDGALTDGSSPLALVKSGAGELTLAGVNTYTAGTTVLDGTLRLAADNALGTGPLSVAAGTVDLCGHSATILSLSGTGMVTNSSVSAAALLTADLTESYGEFGGALADGNGPLGLTKTGAGTLVLWGESTYTGGTTVAAGTLEIAASSALPVGGTLTIDAQGTVVLRYGLTEAAAMARGARRVAPVPEPSTFGLLCAVAIGALACAWRSRRQGIA